MSASPAKVGDVFLNIQGTQFGLVEEASVERVDKLAAETGKEWNDTTVLHKVSGPVFVFCGVRCRIWALLHGYGWVRHY